MKVDDVLPLITAIGQRDYRQARRAVEAMIANERRNSREQPQGLWNVPLNVGLTKT